MKIRYLRLSDQTDRSVREVDHKTESKSLKSVADP